jgi:ABC-type Mn2+/Zn2+ transport system permease subunit
MRSATLVIELLQYDFMQRAFFSATIIGILCAVLGVFVILRGMSFIGAGIAHASFGGVALGFLLGINPILTAILFCVLTAWAIGFVHESGRIQEDTAVGIFFASTMAFGVLLIGFMRHYNVDFFSFIFGNILAISQVDIYAAILLAIIVLLTLTVFFKEFLFLTFDAEMAQVVGIPVRKFNYLMLTLIALTVVVSIKAVGIVLVSALIVTPAATASLFTKDFKRLLMYSVLFGVGSCWLGLFLSALGDLPSGATIVLTATLFFFLSSLITKWMNR